MDREQRQALQRALMRDRPSNSRSDEGISHRIEDLYTRRDVDTRGYTGVLSYIQRGLDDAADAVRSVLRAVSGIQSHGGLGYSLCPMSFGWDDGKLHHDGRIIPTEGAINVDYMVKHLLELAGPRPTAATPLVPALWPGSAPGLRRRQVERGDLLIFFCRDRSVRLSAAAQETYQRVKRRALWVFCDGGTVEWDLGAFEPAAEAEAAPPVDVAASPTANAPLAALTIDEHTGKRWQTTALCNATQTALDGLKRLAAIVATHFIPRDWVCRANKGSITFQHPTDKHQTVCFFVDVGSALLKDSGIVAKGSILREQVLMQTEHVVLAAELTELPPNERQRWREELRRRCGRMYCDPEAGFSKYWLAPNKARLYDVAFLGEGLCELVASAEAEAVIAELFGDGIEIVQADAAEELSPSPTRALTTRLEGASDMARTLPQLTTAPVFQGCLKPDCVDGAVFAALRLKPALREQPGFRLDKADFWHNGGIALSHDGRRFLTHLKYASKTFGSSLYVGESELAQATHVQDFANPEHYEAIKQNIAFYSGQEAKGVAGLLRHSLPSSTGSPDGVVALDLEIGCPNLAALSANTGASDEPEAVPSSDKPKNGRAWARIDLLLLNKGTGALRFYEVKHFSNPELWDNRVIDQVTCYEKYVRNQTHWRVSVAYYEAVVERLQELFPAIVGPTKLQLDAIPVALLVFGFSEEERVGDWQSRRTELAKAGVKSYGRGGMKKLLPSNMATIWNETR